MSVDNGNKDQEALAVAVRGLVNELKAWIASKLKHPAKATAYVFMGVIIIKSLLAVPLVDQLVCQSDLGAEFCEVFNQIEAETADDVIDGK